jgi:cation:H+ antiporter
VIDALLVVAFRAWVYYSGIDRLVTWVMDLGPGFILYDHLGILSGCLMVLPNAVLAAYYARARRADIVYSSQVGDSHICIPMCIGLFAFFSVIQYAGPDANMGIMVILGAGLLHLFFVSFMGRLPRTHGRPADNHLRCLSLCRVHGIAIIIQNLENRLLEKNSRYLKYCSVCGL